MTLSIISQDGTVFNYTNAVACVTCGEYEDDSGYGFMVYLNGDTENGIVVAEYDDEEKFNAVRSDFFIRNMFRYFKRPRKRIFRTVNLCLLVYDEEQGDGLIIESEGTSYARYSQYIPGAKELVEVHQNYVISLTNGEKKLHELLSETAERIAVFAHLNYSEFSFDDVLQDLDCDFDDVKKMWRSNCLLVNKQIITYYRSLDHVT